MAAKEAAARSMAETEAASKSRALRALATRGTTPSSSAAQVLPPADIFSDAKSGESAEEEHAQEQRDPVSAEHQPRESAAVDEEPELAAMDEGAEDDEETNVAEGDEGDEATHLEDTAEGDEEGEASEDDDADEKPQGATATVEPSPLFATPVVAPTSTSTEPVADAKPGATANVDPPPVLTPPLVAPAPTSTGTAAVTTFGHFLETAIQDYVDWQSRHELDPLRVTPFSGVFMLDFSDRYHLASEALESRRWAYQCASEDTARDPITFPMRALQTQRLQISQAELALRRMETDFRHRYQLHQLARTSDRAMAASGGGSSSASTSSTGSGAVTSTSALAAESSTPASGAPTIPLVRDKRLVYDGSDPRLETALELAHHRWSTSDDGDGSLGRSYLCNVCNLQKTFLWGRTYESFTQNMRNHRQLRCTTLVPKASAAGRLPRKRLSADSESSTVRCFHVLTPIGWPLKTSCLCLSLSLHVRVWQSDSASDDAALLLATPSSAKVKLYTCNPHTNNPTKSHIIPFFTINDAPYQGTHGVSEMGDGGGLDQGFLHRRRRRRPLRFRSGLTRCVLRVMEVHRQYTVDACVVSVS